VTRLTTIPKSSGDSLSRCQTNPSRCSAGRYRSFVGATHASPSHRGCMPKQGEAMPRPYASGDDPLCWPNKPEEARRRPLSFVGATHASPSSLCGACRSRARRCLAPTDPTAISCGGGFETRPHGARCVSRPSAVRASWPERNESRDPGATCVSDPWVPDLPPGQARGRPGHAPVDSWA